MDGYYDKSGSPMNVEWDDIHEYVPTRVKSSEPRIIINSSGTFRLNSSFVSTYSKEIKNKKFVKLGYSLKNKSLVIIFSELVKSSTPLSENNTWTAKNFFSSNGIELSKVIGSHEPIFELLDKVGECFIIRF